MDVHKWTFDGYPMQNPTEQIFLLRNVDVLQSHNTLGPFPVPLFARSLFSIVFRKFLEKPFLESFYD